LDTYGSNLVAISLPACDLSLLSSDTLGPKTHKSEVSQ
jgi:hypothetical protein